MSDHAKEIERTIENYHGGPMGEPGDNPNASPAMYVVLNHAHALAAERDRWKRAALAHQQDKEYEDAWAELVKHGDFKEEPTP